MNLRRGSIVWALIRDPRGQNPKRRPIVIVTPSDEIEVDKLVAGVAVTTTATDPPPPECVELPWDASGKSATGLTRRSCAVCNWVTKVLAADVEPSAKYVPQATMLEIIKRLPTS